MKEKKHEEKKKSKEKDGSRSWDSLNSLRGAQEPEGLKIKLKLHEGSVWVVKDGIE